MDKLNKILNVAFNVSMIIFMVSAGYALARMASTPPIEIRATSTPAPTTYQYCRCKAGTGHVGGAVAPR